MPHVRPYYDQRRRRPVAGRAVLNERLLRAVVQQGNGRIVARKGRGSRRGMARVGPVLPDVLTPGAATTQPSEPVTPIDLPLYRILPDNRMDPRVIPVLMRQIARHDPVRNQMVWYGRMFTRES